MAEQGASNEGLSSDQVRGTSMPAAYYLSLTIENFRCFGTKQVLDLTDSAGRPASWTIILGENGVGKTTLLQCIAALRPDTLDLFGKPRSGPYPKRVRRQLVFGSAFRQDGPFAISCGLAIGAKISDKRASIQVADIGVSGDAARFGADGADIDLSGLVCYAYGASRRMGRGALSEQREPDPMASLFQDDVALINAEEWLLQVDYAASRTGADEHGDRAMRSRILGMLAHLLPDVAELRIATRDENRFQPYVEVKTPYGWVPLQSLSLGYRTLMAWMVDLSSRLFDRYPDSENPLAEPAVVLVDEIDLHLHPRWQRSLMGYLSNLFPNTQFIATAHSPLVVQAATNANIVVLRREGDQVVIDNNPAIVRNWRVDQILTSELFGLDSARPPHLDILLAEREKILGKSTLTEADEARLKEIGAKIGDLPTGETPAENEAMDIIRLAAARLKQLNGDVR